MDEDSDKQIRTNKLNIQKRFSEASSFQQVSSTYPPLTNKDQSKQPPRSEPKKISFQPQEVRQLVKKLWTIAQNLRNDGYKMPQSNKEIIKDIEDVLKGMTPFVQYAQTMGSSQNFIILSNQQRQSMKNQVQKLFIQGQKAKQQLLAFQQATDPIIQKYKRLKIELARAKKQNMHSRCKPALLQQRKMFSLKYTHNQLKNDHTKLLIQLPKTAKLSLQLSKSISIKTLKQHIYQKYKDIQPSQMALGHNSRLLTESTSLQDILKQDNELITLRKAQLWQIQQLSTNQKQMDPINLQIGVAYLKCGHAVSRSTMRRMIEFQVDNLQQQRFRCPNQATSSNPTCKQPIQNHLCRLIAGYSMPQWNQIGAKQSNNFLKKYSTQCPKCHQPLYLNEDMKVDRFKCPCCQVQICAQCRQLWKGQNLCESEECSTVRNLLKMSQEITRLSEGAKSSDSLRIFKQCPHCSRIIQNPILCNLYTCQNCRKKYCFVCLKPYCEKKGWTCGQSCNRSINQKQLIIPSKVQQANSQFEKQNV